MTTQTDPTNTVFFSFFNQRAKAACDQKCDKAWGIQNRPRTQLSNDDDDWEWHSDTELGTAPIDPGTYEGGHAKPLDKTINKWCVRECERCVISAPGRLDEDLFMKDFSRRIPNMRSPRFDINRLDYYETRNPASFERTKQRLTDMAAAGMQDLGVAEFGYKGVFSGFYIERVWHYSNEDFRAYMDWARGLIRDHELKNRGW
jgi:hypothetical protein